MNNRENDNRIRKEYKWNKPGTKITYDHVKKVFLEFGYTLVSDKYVSAKDELEYICNKHKEKGIQKIKYGNLMKSSKCVYCMYEDGYSLKRIPDDIINDVLNSSGYSYVDKYYDNEKLFVKFICNKHHDMSIQESTFSDIKSSKSVCKYCNGYRDTNGFKDLIKNKHPNIDVIGEYTGARKRIKCKCKIHNYVWSPFAYNLITGYGCKLCGQEATGEKERLTYQEKLDKLKLNHQDDIEFLFIPDLTSQYVKCKCKHCNNIWEATYSNLAKPNYTGCPKCKYSRGEKIISQYFAEHNIDYVSQKKFDDCRDIFPLPFDFYIESINCCIEYDGKQHYQLSYFGNWPEEEARQNLETIQRHDKIKNIYCLENNIKLIRIPYWNIRKIYELLDNEL